MFHVITTEGKGHMRFTTSQGYSWRYYHIAALLLVRGGVQSALSILCAMTGHVGSCWLLNHSPLHRLWAWSVRHKVAGMTAYTQ